LAKNSRSGLSQARPARSTDPLDDDWRLLHQSFHNALVGACGLKSLLNYRSKLIVLSDHYRRLSSIVPSDRPRPRSRSDRQELTMPNEPLEPDQTRGPEIFGVTTTSETR
jgi:DNA-binding GntR family transcriptional regulator